MYGPGLCCHSLCTPLTQNFSWLIVIISLSLLSFFCYYYYYPYYCCYYCYYYSFIILLLLILIRFSLFRLLESGQHRHPIYLTDTRRKSARDSVLIVLIIFIFKQIIIQKDCHKLSLCVVLVCIKFCFILHAHTHTHELNPKKVETVSDNVNAASKSTTF